MERKRKSSNLEERNESNTEATRLPRTMGLWTGVSIIVGSIIGGGIFVSPTSILKSVGSPGAAILVWFFSGVLCLLGAFVYAELGLTIPTSGGDYIYVLRIFGSLMAFLRLWIAIMVICPVQLAIMAWVFSQNVVYPFYQGCKGNEFHVKLITVAAILIVTYMTCKSTKIGVYTNNLFTLAKVSALFLIVVLGTKAFSEGKNDNLSMKNMWNGTSANLGDYAEATLAGLFSYQGWSFLNYVVDELIDPERNLPLSIIISMALCNVIYLLVNLAYFSILTPTEMLHSPTIAIDVANIMLPEWLGWLLPLCVATSCIGAVLCGVIIASRIFLSGAKEKQMPDIIAMINYNNLTPVPALICTGGLSITYLLSGAGIYTLMSYCMFVNWIWYGASAVGLIYWRFTRPDIPRPFVIQLIVPVLFVALCAGLLIFSIYKQPRECGCGMLISLLGVPVYYATVKYQHKHPDKMKQFMRELTRQGQLLFCVVPEET